MINSDIDLSAFPESIQTSLQNLSKDNDILKNIDKGSNGYLLFGKNHILNKDVAFKYYYYGGDKQYHAEPKYLASISSPNILKIHYAETICDEWALFITDLCKYGDLDDFFSKTPISVKNALICAYDILSGISILHSKKLVHRDLKPQNILIDENQKPLIGYFGSVKIVPDGKDCIPGSGHSILYRPPEGFVSGNYYYNSDIYQVGIVMYQLLGGTLSYNANDYLSDKDKKELSKITDPCDQQIFTDSIIKNKIVKGKLLDYSSLPCWIDKKTISILKKATDVNAGRRYSHCSEMMNDIAKVKPKIHNWVNHNGIYILNAATNYRVILDKGLYVVEKRKHSDWRRDNSYIPDKKYQKLIVEINKKIKA